MAYDRYPVERRSNQPQYAPEQPDYPAGQPASRTRFYRDKRNGKVMGICAGIADYTGFDVALIRICMIGPVPELGLDPADLFHCRLGHSGQAQHARAQGQRSPAILAGRPSIANPCRPRHSFAHERHRPAPCRHRKLRDH